jgi:hypothetical protein
MATTNLPATFNPILVSAFLRRRVSESNRKACMRVILKLISGVGVTHKAKRGETFLQGHRVSPHDDLEALRARASRWLPYKGPNALDRGHGWALNHPLTKLIEYKRYLLGATLPPPVERTMARSLVDRLSTLQHMFHMDIIDEDEYTQMSMDALARV